MSEKILSYITFGIAAIVLMITLFGGGKTQLGGTTNFDALDVTDGYMVDGTNRIDGSGVGQFATLNATTLLASSTNLGTNTAATSTVTHLLRFTASSTAGIVMPIANGAGTTCIRIFLNSSSNIATSSVSCN